MFNIMSRKFFYALPISLLFLASFAWAAPVALVNPSFEDPALPDGAHPPGVTGWDSGGTVSTWNPQVNQTSCNAPNDDPTAALVDNIPDGDQVLAASGGGFVFQDTGVFITPGHTYTLKVWTTGRCYGGATPKLFNLRLDAITIGMVAESGTTNAAAETWVENTVTYVSPPGDLNAGLELRVVLHNLSSGSIQIDFDHVRLDDDDGSTPPLGTEFIHFDCVAPPDPLGVNDNQCVPRQASVEGPGTVHPDLEISSASGGMSKQKAGATPGSFAAPLASFTYNNCFENEFGQRVDASDGDHFTPAKIGTDSPGPADILHTSTGGFWGITNLAWNSNPGGLDPVNGTRHDITFDILNGFTVNFFSIRMFDFGDKNPTALTNHQVLLIAYDAGGNEVSRDDLTYTSNGDGTTSDFGRSLNCTSANSCLSTVGGVQHGRSGDACIAEGDFSEPGYRQLQVQGTGIAKVVLYMPAFVDGDPAKPNGYDSNASYDSIRFTKEDPNVIPPNLTLVKTLTKDDGGTANETDWILSADGPTPISGASGSPAVTNADVDPGTYTLSESGGPTGYTAGPWSCDGGVQLGDVLTLANGDVVTCTINNDDDAPPHFSCYQAVTPKDIEFTGTRRIGLTDQFGGYGYDTVKVERLCAPVNKTPLNYTEQHPVDVADVNGTHLEGYEIEESELSCGVCEGGVNEVTIQYNGVDPVSFFVDGKVTDTGPYTLTAGESFTLWGSESDGKMGSNIKFLDAVNGDEIASFHTSCSRPFGIGSESGGFVVIGGSSVDAGDLGVCDIPIPWVIKPPWDTCNPCTDGVFSAKWIYNGTDGNVTVVDKDGSVLFDAFVAAGGTFEIFPLIGDDKLDKTIFLTGSSGTVEVHTSCSKPYGPGLEVGDFTLLESVNGKGVGDMCPVVRIDNQFGTEFLYIEKLIRLLVPTLKDLAGPPVWVPPTDTDHFTCYEVKSLGLQEGLEVNLEDQFDTRDFEIDKTELLCNPVEKAHIGFTPIIIEHGHLACYKIKPLEKGLCALIDPAGDPSNPAIGQICGKDSECGDGLFCKKEVNTSAFLANQFGEEIVDVKKAYELCVPSIKTVGPQ